MTDDISSEKKVSPDRARQGSRGWHVLIILVCSLILVALAWLGAEIYGHKDAKDGTPSAPPAATQTQPPQ